MTRPRRSSRRAYDRVNSSGEGNTTGNVYSRRRRGLAARGRRRLGRGGRGNEDDEAGRRMLNEPLAPNVGEDLADDEDDEDDEEDYDDEDDFDEELGANESGDVDDEESEGGVGQGTGTNRKGKVAVSPDEDPLRGAAASTQDTAIKPKSSPTAISVVVLDGATSRFNVEVEPTWTVMQFKEAGSKVYKVQPEAQRLIHMGKLLSDTAVLKDVGINADNKIVHLFPKPNVVFGGSNERDDNTQSEDTVNTAASRVSDGEESSGGAHVPQIVVDAEEAERRSQVVILNSVEVFEAQSRVKLLSFLLLIVSSMELLTLFTLFFGSTSTANNDDDGLVEPSDPVDNSTSSTNDDYGTPRTWRRSDYADTLIALFGFYVALLGIRATTENTVAIVRRYFICLVVLAVAWNIYDYMLAVRDRREHEENEFGDGENGDGLDIYIAAFLGILLPFLVWCICVLRAWQFHRLITQAERESEERRQGIESASAAAASSASPNTAGAGEANDEEGANASTAGVEVPGGSSAATSTMNDEADLELQVEGRSLT